MAAHVRREADYFRIGVFVILGIVLIIVAILAFSSTGLFEKRILIETYFNESVQGLSVGSPVKYRGIDIGEVKEIKLISGVYHLPADQMNSEYGRYVYVLMSLHSDFLPGVPSGQLSHVLQGDVGRGLRVKMALQGLTGGVYLELNFVNPSNNPKLPIIWKPDHLYIPSSLSTFTRLTDSISSILNGLKDVDFKKLFNNMQGFVGRSESLVTTMDEILRLNQTSISATLDNSRVISANLRDISGTISSNPSSILFSRPPVVDPGKL